MFGWEFPPHILGGLGTASYGLTRGMWECGDMEIDFVIPKPWGDEDRSFARIIGASQVPVAWRDVSRDYVEQRIGRYMSPEMYFGLRDHMLVAWLTAPRPANGGLPSYSCEREPMHPWLISSSKPMSMRSM